MRTEVIWAERFPTSEFDSRLPTFIRHFYVSFFLEMRNGLPEKVGRSFYR